MRTPSATERSNMAAQLNRCGTNWGCFGIYYTCMNSWMQLGLLRDLLHLHELVIGNLAFISDRHVHVNTT